MGWSSGSELASKMIEIMERLDDGVYTNGIQGAYNDMIIVFEKFDCDNLHECLGENWDFDAAYDKLYPSEE